MTYFKHVTRASEQDIRHAMDKVGRNRTKVERELRRLLVGNVRDSAAEARFMSPCGSACASLWLDSGLRLSACARYSSLRAAWTSLWFWSLSGSRVSM